ncbi:hypothetical protein Q3G72_014312 [Acer saccharum]|nr:hypothetical protein Q3G72_014312 [Acer saccharum]
MENGIDFLHVLDPDMSSKIFMCLEDPSDLVRVSTVSPFWQQHVIANGLCKQLCLRLFPRLSKVDNVIELMSSTKNPAEVGSSNFTEWESLKKEHRAYAFLARGFTSFAVKQLIVEPIAASSTDNFPTENIYHTLNPSKRARRITYWSSEGQRNPAVPETLTYKLDGDLCLINEINIQPFQVFFQRGRPIYSAKAVRFRMGHVKQPKPPVGPPLDVLHSIHDCFVWTYTSEEFPMAQENRLQNFKLPEPVLCIGGIMQVELLGRVQKQEMDSLFYICVALVQIVGRSLAPAFSVDIDEHAKLTLKVPSYNQPSPPDIPSTNSSFFDQRHVRDYYWVEEDDESSDEEFDL